MMNIHDEMPTVWQALSALLEQAEPQSAQLVSTIDVDEAGDVLLTLHVVAGASASRLAAHLTPIGRTLSHSFARPIRVALQLMIPEVPHV